MGRKDRGQLGEEGGCALAVWLETVSLGENV